MFSLSSFLSQDVLEIFATKTCSPSSSFWTCSRERGRGGCRFSLVRRADCLLLSSVRSFVSYRLDVCERGELPSLRVKSSNLFPQNFLTPLKRKSRSSGLDQLTLPSLINKSAKRGDRILQTTGSRFSTSARFFTFVTLSSRHVLVTNIDSHKSSTEESNFIATHQYYHHKFAITLRNSGIFISS